MYSHELIILLHKAKLDNSDDGLWIIKSKIRPVSFFNKPDNNNRFIKDYFNNMLERHNKIKMLLELGGSVGWSIRVSLGRAMNVR